MNLFIQLLPFYGLTSGLYIQRLSVPRAIQANVSEVVLDCDYKVEEWEKQNGFVLKWYINSVNLVYQWIPPRPPQVLGTLRGRVDTTYRASKDPWEEHRALRILKPDPGLTGTYSCTVATFETEDTDSANMLVWVPPRSVELHYWRPSEYFVNITCSAYEVSPKPIFGFYLMETNGRRHAIAIHGRTDEKTLKKGHYVSQSWGLVVYAATSSKSTLGCTIFIPGTSYLEKREKIYHPDIPIHSTEKLSYTTAKNYPPEEGAVRLPSLPNRAGYCHPNMSVLAVAGLVLILFPFQECNGMVGYHGMKILKNPSENRIFVRVKMLFRRLFALAKWLFWCFLVLSSFDSHFL